MSKIKKNIKNIDNELDKYNFQKKNAIRLVAVSKGQSHTKVIEAYNEGQKIFGENYLQEAIDKKKLLEGLVIEWHFI